MSELPQAFGEYVLLKSLGSGVSGEVFLAKPRDAKKANVPSPVVIKRLHAELADDRAFAMRFKQEAQIAIAIDHPHVAKVYDVGQVGPTFYMAIEYIPGWTLSRVISDLRESGGFASFSSIRDMLGDALEGLEAVHGAIDPTTREPLHVVHRDLAPKNLILGEDSTTKLIDFGIGKSAYQDWKTNTGVVVGSPGYMSPEQARGQGIDQRSDIYAMGLILWELITSKSFIERGPVPVMLRAQAEPAWRPPSAIRPDTPKRLEAVAEKALARDPAARFQSAKEMQAALYAAVGPRSEGQVSSTIVGALLWGELGESKTEMTQLLSQPRSLEHANDATESEPPSADTIVFAMRKLPPPPPAATPPPQPLPQLSQPQIMMMMPPPRTQIPWLYVVGLMLLTLAVGILIAAHLFGR
jgi:serine/threonine protein kinase